MSCQKKQTIYVVTYHEFNHGSLRPGVRKPLDERLLDERNNYVFYLIDKEIPDVLKNRQTILEYDIDPTLHAAGGKHFGEWSFLLAEEKHSFCQYPFFMISSRFYEKNLWLHRDLNEEWTKLFSYLEKYGYGYLPSYDRPMRWIDMSWEKKWKKEAWKYTFFPFTNKTYELFEQIFGINIPKDYRYTADLFCNYIGFNSRKDLLEYVAFYKPLINHFFDANMQPKRDIDPYVRNSRSFRNEKPFTFLLETLCHLFFFQRKKTYFALHYDGYYEVDESSKKMKKLEKITPPFLKAFYRLSRWQVRKLKTEGCLAPINHKIATLKHKVKQYLSSES